ncbi:unnamed protein product, partial [Choristocarpus tenellus]
GEYAPRLAVPRSLVSNIIALVHLQTSHQGVGRTVALTHRYFFWPSLHKDTQDYVLSCGCRRDESVQNRTIVRCTLFSKFLEPWDVLEMDLQDVRHISAKGNKYLLIVIDRASRFPFAFPMASKEATGIATNVLELLLTFGIPLSICSDAGEGSSQET